MTITEQHRQTLRQGAKALRVDLTSEQEQSLLSYLALLAKWNKAYNLTAVRHVDEMVPRHLLDSLTVVPYIQGDKWLDVGSGGGMPGIILAILYPHKHFTLLDSNGKKTRFLTQVVLELTLKNVCVVNERVEYFKTEIAFSGIISRAFSSLDDFVSLTRHLTDAQTQWLAMKGVYPQEELQALPSNVRLVKEHVLEVPCCQGQRHLFIIEPIA